MQPRCSSRRPWRLLPLWSSALFAVIASAAFAAGESPDELIYVSNERSGDLSIIDAATDQVVTTIPVGKRPRGIHCAPDGTRIFVAVSGSPRMAPGVDSERAAADKSADGLAVVDATQRRVVERWHAGSDPEQFAISKDGSLAFIANEDEASL